MDWKALSALGILWGFAHLALEAPLGAGGSNLWKLVLASTVVWLLALLLAMRGARWAVYATILLGATVCFWLALSHFARPGSHTIWLAFIPWMTDPEDAPHYLVPPYNLLMYSGVGLGLAIVWTGIRSSMHAGTRSMWLPFAIAAAVTATGLADMARHAAYEPGAGLIWTVAAGLLVGAVGISALMLTPGGTAARQAD